MVVVGDGQAVAVSKDASGERRLGRRAPVCRTWRVPRLYPKERRLCRSASDRNRAEMRWCVCMALWLWFYMGKGEVRLTLVMVGCSR